MYKYYFNDIELMSEVSYSKQISKDTSLIRHENNVFPAKYQSENLSNQINFSCYLPLEKYKDLKALINSHNPVYYRDYKDNEFWCRLLNCRFTRETHNYIFSCTIVQVDNTEFEDEATQVYQIVEGIHDGYVRHEDEIIVNTSNSLLLGAEYWEEDTDCDFYLYFTNIGIPKNAEIVSATLGINVYVDFQTTTTKFRASKNDVLILNYADYDNLIGTSAYTEVVFESDSFDEYFKEIDVTEIIQEKINENDWQQLNNILLYTGETVKSSDRAGADIDSVEYKQVTALTIVFKTPDTLKELLLNTRTESFKYEHLKLINNKYQHHAWINNYVYDCNTTVDFDRDVVANCNIEIDNRLEIDYLSDLIRPYYCIGEYELPLGTFLLLSPDMASDGKNTTRRVQGYDLLLAVEQYRQETSTTIAKGTNVITKVKQLLDEIGAWVAYQIEDSSAVTIEDMSYEVGRSNLFIINSLLNAINYYPLQVDGNGIFTTLSWTGVENVVWDFEDDENSLYEQGISVQNDYTEFYNKVIVVANQLEQDTEPFISVLTMEDLGMDEHPYSYTSIGRYVTKVFDSEAVTQEYCDVRAERELKKMLETEEVIEYNHAFVSNREEEGISHIEDSYRFKNKKLNLEANYKIVRQDYVLKAGSRVKSMLRRVVNV